VSRLDDDDDEMARRELDDDAVETLLAGRTVSPGWDTVSAFVVEARSAGRGEPPAPSPELQAILSEGLSFAPETDAAPRRSLRGDRAATGGPARRSRRMAVAELVAGLGLGAKVLLGAGMASASLTAAGAAGVLPGPVDHAVEGVVRTATPFDISDDDGPATDDDGNFGSIVSEDATDPSSPGVDGHTIASMAHDRHDDGSTTTTAPSTTTTTTEGSTTTTTTDTTGSTTADGNQGLGDTVSDDARGEDGTPGVDGQTVASEARQHGRDHNSTTTTTTSDTTTTTTTASPAEADDDAPGASGNTPGATAPGSGGEHPSQGRGGGAP
jgi:hypothetical protein